MYLVVSFILLFKKEKIDQKLLIFKGFSFLKCLFCKFGVFFKFFKKESVPKPPIYYTT